MKEVTYRPELGHRFSESKKCEIRDYVIDGIYRTGHVFVPVWRGGILYPRDTVILRIIVNKYIDGMRQSGRIYEWYIRCDKFGKIFLHFRTNRTYHYMYVTDYGVYEFDLGRINYLHYEHAKSFFCDRFESVMYYFNYEQEYAAKFKANGIYQILIDPNETARKLNGEYGKVIIQKPIYKVTSNPDHVLDAGFKGDEFQEMEVLYGPAWVLEEDKASLIEVIPQENTHARIYPHPFTIPITIFSTGFIGTTRYYIQNVVVDEGGIEGVKCRAIDVICDEVRLCDKYVTRAMEKRTFIVYHDPKVYSTLV